MSKFSLFFFALSFCTSSNAFVQGNTDTLGHNSLLYSGIEYTRGLILFGETPFYLGAETFQGKVKYRGNFYNVPKLQYDCSSDVLVIRDRLGDLAVELINEKIDEFTINGHHFDKLKIQGNRSEFYEKIHTGRYNLFVQWKKIIISNRLDEKRYQLINNVFLLNANDTIRINKASDYFDLLGQNKGKIKRYYKEEHLNFRKEPVLSMVSMVKKAESEGW